VKYYVDDQISASGAGDSWASAWKNFSDINWKAIQPGDTIYISGGSAAGDITITKGVDPGHNGTVIIDGQEFRPNGVSDVGYNYVAISGLAVRNITDAGFSVKDVSAGVVVQNNSVYSGDSGGGNARGYDVRNSVGQNAVIVRDNSYSTPASTKAQTDGIWSSGNNGVVFENNNIVIANTDSTGHSDGIQSYEDTNVIFNGNYISHPNGGLNNHGMWISDIAPGGTVTVENNVVSMPVGDEMAIAVDNVDSGWTGQADIYNNTVSGGSRDYEIWNAPLSHLENNIAAPAAGGVGVMIYGGDPKPGNINHNLIWAPSATVANVDGRSETWAQWQAQGYDANGVNVDPLFSNAENNDFSLQAGSPAIHAGGTIPSVTDDYAGSARPQGGAYDIGAYEHTATSSSAPPTASSPSTSAPPASGSPTSDPASTPAPASSAPTEDTLVLNLSGNLRHSNPEFIVSVDGKQQGGINSVTASHSRGQSEAFSFHGSFGSGAHDIAVSFINGSSGGRGMHSTLYVNSVDYDGRHYGSATATLHPDSSVHFTVAAPTGNGGG
jgi:hypothetical protein